MTEVEKRSQHSQGRIFLAALIIWILLQLSRFIALKLIGDIGAGLENSAWMFPAYLDLFAAIFAVPLALAVWKWRGIETWSVLIIYFAISIVDHLGNFVTTSLVGEPSIVPQGQNPILFPLIMTVFDVLFVTLLLVPKYRQLFFRTEHKEPG